MTDILQAARSYYGLADTESCTTQLFTNQAGQTCVAFEIPLSNEDFAAIVQRMQNMQQPDTQPDTAIIEGPTVADLRRDYDALSRVDKGRYGSFARYIEHGSNGVLTVKEDGSMGRKVVHVDTPEEPEPTNMDAVWIPAWEVSDAQMQFASDRREVKAPSAMHVEYLIQWAMLTDEQKQKAKP